MNIDTGSVIKSWELYLQNRPKVDLTNIKPGQKVLTKHGKILFYKGKHADTNYPYPYEFHYHKQKQTVYTRTVEGWTYRHKPLPNDEDIIYIFPFKEKSIKKKIDPSKYQTGSVIRDGGTFTITYKGKKYYVDHRVRSTTKGEIYDLYPGDPEAKIVELYED